MLQSLARVLRPAPWRYELLHSERRHRLIWIIQGQGRILFGPRMRGISPGTLVFIPARQNFVLEAGSNTNGHVLHADPPSSPLWPDQPMLVRSGQLYNQSALQTELDAIQREQDIELSHKAAALQARLSLCAVWLQRQLLQMPLAEKPNAADRVIERFLALLEKRYNSNDAMADYAENLNLTATHLSRVCKAQLGRSAADLIAQRTLHAARDMLETTGHPAKEIAKNLGFGTAAYFSRYIVNHTGQTPRQLRQQARQNTRSVGL